MRPRPTRPLLAAAVVATMLALAACGGDAAAPDESGETASAAEDGALVIYSGRSETLVGSLLTDLEAAVGTPVQVRYASSSELAAQLLEEGERTDADLFFSQDAGALGALKKADMLAALDPAVIAPVPEQYRDADGRWVATSARQRVIAYDPAQVATTPDAVDDLLDPRWKGMIGYAPTNPSFQSFVTALRLDRGEDGAREWLEAFKANEPTAYDNNVLALDAVDRGEVAMAPINHYYWYEKVAEVGADGVNARLAYLPADDPGSLVNVAGVGVLATSDQADAAGRAVAFLLGDEAQQFFADETAEYPVVPGITSAVNDLPPLADLEAFRVDLNDLDSLEQTLALLDEVGLT